MSSSVSSKVIGVKIKKSNIGPHLSDSFLIQAWNIWGESWTCSSTSGCPWNRKRTGRINDSSSCNSRDGMNMMRLTSIHNLLGKIPHSNNNLYNQVVNYIFNILSTKRTSTKLDQVQQKQTILISALEQRLYALDCSEGSDTSRYGASSSAVTTPPFDEIYCPICEFIQGDVRNLYNENLNWPW